MSVESESPAEEIRRLRRCINDLVSVLALPATWTGGTPSQIVGNSLDALVSMLSLDFAYARLRESTGTAFTEIVRVGSSWEPKHRPEDIGKKLKPWLENNPETLSVAARNLFGTRATMLVPLPMGLHAEIGVIVAGSQRADFPQQAERLVLNIAANQAAIGLRGSSLLSIQRRVASELDQRVTQRTAELAATNEELRKEIVERKSVEERRRLVEEALNQTRSELAHMARVTTLSTLTASIAHEVNQPLSGIVTNASTCLRMLDASPPNVEGARETARRTIRDGNRASEVIARLRALFSKKNAAFEVFDLNEAAKEVVALSVSELQRNRVILQPDLAVDLPSVLGDRIQIQQVILNLLRNGVDAMNAVDHRPRELLIKTECDDNGGVRLSVKDLGMGIDSEIEEKLFEAFYTTKADGMGIGLSVSRSIVERHQGRLWAIRNEGPGATFLFSIPCSANT